MRQTTFTHPGSILRLGQRVIAAAGLMAFGHCIGLGAVGCANCDHNLTALYPVTGTLPAQNGSHDAAVCAENGCPTALGGAELSSCTAEAARLRCQYHGGYDDPSDNLEELDESDCNEACSGVLEDGVLDCVAAPDGTPACVSRGGCVGGRGFAGMPGFAVADDIAHALGEMAHLEACSVTAFTMLAQDLALLGAPASLVRRCMAAAADESRHRRLLLELARAHGFGEPVEVPAPHRRPVTLEGLARENRVEGCIREAWGALAVAWLGRRWPDRSLRPLWRAIARDEARHAALAWAIDAWAARALPSDARERVAAAGRCASEELEHAPPDWLLAHAGVDAPTQRRAVHELTRELAA